MVYVRHVSPTNEGEFREYTYDAYQGFLEKSRCEAAELMVNTDKQGSALYATESFDFDRDILSVTIYHDFICSKNELESMNKDVIVYAFHSKDMARGYLKHAYPAISMRHISHDMAKDFIVAHHRHNPYSPQFRISLGAFVGDKLVGVAVLAQPNARRLIKSSENPDLPFSCEIVRLCTDGTKNACSMLYSKCGRIAKELGYEKVYTYILESENGASLKAAGFSEEVGLFGGKTGKWTGAKYKDTDSKHPTELKHRWVLDLC